MVALRKALKRRIVAAEEGVTLDRPYDAVIDPEKHRVAALVISRGSALEVSVVCRAEEIHRFNADILTANGIGSVRLAYQDPEILELLRRGLHIRGRSVLSLQGRSMGRISDAEIDDDGSVVEYRLRSGLLGWLRPARRLPVASVATLGEDIAIAKDPDRGATEKPAATGEAASGSEDQLGAQDTKDTV